MASFVISQLDRTEEFHLWMVDPSSQFRQMVRAVGVGGVHFDSLNRPFCSIKRKETNLQFMVTMLAQRNYFTKDPQCPHFGVFLGKLPRDLGK